MRTLMLFGLKPTDIDNIERFNVALARLDGDSGHG